MLNSVYTCMLSALTISPEKVCANCTANEDFPLAVGPVIKRTGSVGFWWREIFESPQLYLLPLVLYFCVVDKDETELVRSYIV